MPPGPSVEPSRGPGAGVLAGTSGFAFTEWKPGFYPADLKGDRMLWLKAFHVVFVVTWFAGLFYLPRLFVYHSTATDELLSLIHI